MNAIVRRISSGVVVLLLSSLSSLAVAGHGESVTGTYSSLKYNSESGDLSGYEIQIVPVVGGYRAILQLAEGEVTDVVVSDASVDKNGVISAEFVLRSGRSCKLKARYADEKLVGTLSFERSGDVELVAARSMGYWDKP